MFTPHGEEGGIYGPRVSDCCAVIQARSCRSNGYRLMLALNPRLGARSAGVLAWIGGITQYQDSKGMILSTASPPFSPRLPQERLNLISCPTPEVIVKLGFITASQLIARGLFPSHGLSSLQLVATPPTPLCSLSPKPDPFSDPCHPFDSFCWPRSVLATRDNVDRQCALAGGRQKLG